jgi:hypothetical protein
MKLDAIGVLFANSWRRLQERFSVVAQIWLVPLVLIVIGRMLLMHRTLAAAALGGLINLVAGIISVLASVALIAAFSRSVDFAESYRTGIALFWQAVWISILVTLAVVGGLVLLIIPSIILAIQLVFASYVMVIEGKRGLAALAQSREYLKGYWWAFLGRSILLGLILGAGMLVFYLPAMLLAGKVIGALVYGAVLLVFVPFSIAYHYEIFENLRRLKPSAVAEAAKAETGFLKASIVVGIVGIVTIIILLVAALAFFGAAIVSQIHTGGDRYGNWPALGTSTAPYDRSATSSAYPAGPAQY